MSKVSTVFKKRSWESRNSSKQGRICSSSKIIRLLLSSQSSRKSKFICSWWLSAETYIMFTNGRSGDCKTTSWNPESLNPEAQTGNDWVTLGRTCSQNGKSESRKETFPQLLESVKPKQVVGLKSLWDNYSYSDLICTLNKILLKEAESLIFVPDSLIFHTLQRKYKCGGLALS